jgi:hypothetical protein
MIGGYLFQYEQEEITGRLNTALQETYHRIPCGQAGFLFYDQPFADAPTASYASEHLTMLSQDLLVVGDADGGEKADVSNSL